jgi:hypothetical protein
LLDKYLLFLIICIAHQKEKRTLEEKIRDNLLVAFFDRYQPSENGIEFGITVNECARPEQGAPGTGGTWWTRPGDEKPHPQGINLRLLATNDLLSLKQLSAKEAKLLSPNEAMNKYGKEISRNASCVTKKTVEASEKVHLQMRRLLLLTTTLANQ